MTTEYGVFTARTKRRALALAAAAKKEHDAATKERLRQIELARLIAHSNAFRILRAYLDRGDATNKIKPYEYVSRDQKAFPSLVEVDPAGQTCFVHFDHGPRAHKFGLPIVGCVVSGNGYPVAIVTSNSVTAEEFVIAVGSRGEHVASEVIPCVKSSHFTPFEEN